MNNTKEDLLVVLVELENAHKLYEKERKSFMVSIEKCFTCYKSSYNFLAPLIDNYSCIKDEMLKLIGKATLEEAIKKEDV